MELLREVNESRYDRMRKDEIKAAKVVADSSDEDPLNDAGDEEEDDRLNGDDSDDHERYSASSKTDKPRAKLYKQKAEATRNRDLASAHASKIPQWKVAKHLSSDDEEDSRKTHRTSDDESDPYRNGSSHRTPKKARFPQRDDGTDESPSSKGHTKWMRKRSDGRKGARQPIGLGEIVWVDKDALNFATKIALKGTYGTIRWANYVRQLAKVLMSQEELCQYVVKGRSDRKSRCETRPMPKELLHAIYCEVEKRQKEKWEENEKNPAWDDDFANFQLPDINRALAQVFLEARASAAKAAQD